MEMMKSKGGWLRNGRQATPGRLNELRHVIYKDQEHTFAESKSNISLMVKDGLLKENIDGEAIEWVYERIHARNQAWNIIIHLSDGAPVDDSTLSVNPANFLTDHYRKATNFVYERPDTNIYAISLQHKNKTWVFNDSVTLTNDFDGSNLDALCDHVSNIEVPTGLPQGSLASETNTLSTTVTTQVGQLISLFWEDSSIVSHKNFRLLSDDLKTSIYDFFDENKEEISWELQSAIMNFVLGGNPEEVSRKMEVILDISFCKKWMLWSEKVAYRSLEDFYRYDYVASVRDSDMVVYESFIEWYKLHGSEVFTILNALVNIKNPDFVARLTHRIITVFHTRSEEDKHILEWAKRCGDRETLEFYESLKTDEEKDVFIWQLLRTMDDVNWLGCSFDSMTFCILYKAGINKAYIAGLKTFFTPKNESNVKMLKMWKELLGLDSKHVWAYFQARNKLFEKQIEVWAPFEALYFSQRDHEDAERLNEVLRWYEHQQFFLEYFREDVISQINQLPEDIFQALLENKDIMSLLNMLKSGEFLELKPYFDNPYFIAVLRNTKEKLNKKVFNFLLIFAKKWEFFELDENFLKWEQIIAYLGETLGVEQVLKWFQEKRKIDNDLLQPLTFLLWKTEFFDKSKMRLVKWREQEFLGVDAVHVTMLQLIYDLDILHYGRLDEFDEDILKNAYGFFRGIIDNKHAILSSCMKQSKSKIERAITKVTEYLERISEYQKVFLQSEAKVLFTEKKDREEHDSEYWDMDKFLTISQEEFHKIYSGLAKKVWSSQKVEEQSLLQEMNAMRDVLNKIRAWR